MPLQEQIQYLDCSGQGNTATIALQSQAVASLAPGFYSTARVFVAGAFTGSLVFEESPDGSTWYTSSYVLFDTSPAGGFSPTVTLAGSYTIALIGTQRLRLRVVNPGVGIASVLFALTTSSIGISLIASQLGTGVAVTSLPAGATVAVNNLGTGLGPLVPVPAGSTNGTALGIPPTGSTGFRFYLAQGDVVTGTFALVQPTAAPANTFSFIGPDGPNIFTEPMVLPNMFYVTVIDGAPLFRWI